MFESSNPWIYVIECNSVFMSIGSRRSLLPSMSPLVKSQVSIVFQCLKISGQLEQCDAIYNSGDSEQEVLVFMSVTLNAILLEMRLLLLCEEVLVQSSVCCVSAVLMSFFNRIGGRGTS